MSKSSSRPAKMSSDRVSSGRRTSPKQNKSIKHQLYFKISSHSRETRRTLANIAPKHVHDTRLWPDRFERTLRVRAGTHLRNGLPTANCGVLWLLRITCAFVDPILWVHSEELHIAAGTAIRKGHCEPAEILLMKSSRDIRHAGLKGYSRLRRTCMHLSLLMY